MRNLRGDVPNQARKGAGRLGDGRIADEKSKTVRGGLDVVQERGGGGFDESAGVGGGAQCSGERTEQRLDFPVDDDGVNSLFAAEVLINHRLGNLGASRDFFDTGPIEAFFRKEGARNGEELFAPFLTGHARFTCGSIVLCHASMMTATGDNRKNRASVGADSRSRARAGTIDNWCVLI